MTTFASICSGIEAASVAWEPLGWHCLWLAEIDKAASAVLAYRYPHVPNLGDLITLADRMTAGEMPPPDVLIGGTPCQAFSIAGLRGGMDDPRGALTMAFVRLVDTIDARRALLGWPPVIVVWENVPGVLNHKDNPFGCFLAGLAGEDLPLVPSGKRWTHAGLVSGPARSIAWRTLDAQYFGLAQRRRRVFVVASADPRCDPAAILFESEGVRRDIAPSRETGESFTHAVAGSLTSSGRGTDCAPTLRASGHVSSHSNAGAPPAVCVTEPVTHCLRAEGFDASEDGTGRGQPITFSIMPMNSGRDYVARPTDIAQPLLAAGPGGGNQGGDYVTIHLAVRRLLPVECERLQGFPDGWTERGAKPQADGPRYKQLGNSVPVPVIRWLGQRIEAYL